MATEPPGVREQLSVLEAFEAVLADPVRLVTLLQDAEDDAAAVRSVSDAFGITPAQAEAVLDQQFRLVLPGRRSAIAAELEILRSPWQEPLALELVGTGGTRATLTVDGDVQRFTARSARLLVDQVVEFLREQVVVPQLRPVVLTTGLAGRDPVRVRIWPTRSTSYEYADD
jgi:hypothetical protein